MLRKVKGFQNAISLIGTGGIDAVSVTLWDLKEHAEAYNSTTYPGVLKTLSTILEGSPKVTTYEVTSSTFGNIAAHAAV